MVQQNKMGQTTSSSHSNWLKLKTITRTQIKLAQIKKHNSLKLKTIIRTETDSKYTLTQTQLVFKLWSLTVSDATSATSPSTEGKRCEW